MIAHLQVCLINEALIIGLLGNDGAVVDHPNTVFYWKRLSQTSERLETLMAILFQIAIYRVESYY